MNLAEALAVLGATVVGMELLAYAMHRWVMHGPGWVLHASHHRTTRRGRFEANDLYAVLFAAVSITLFAVGGGPSSLVWWIGAGTVVYGILYAFVHDGITHRRWRAWKAPSRGYVARLVRAHRLHHAVTSRDGAVSFGFLWAASPERLARQLRHDASLRRRASVRMAEPPPLP